MAQEPMQKFNGNSKGFSLGWDSPDTSFKSSKSFLTNKIQSKEIMSNARGQKFLDKKNVDISAKIGCSDFKYVFSESTPKITRNDRERSTFYFGDIAPQSQKTLQKRQKTQRQREQDTKRYDTLKTLKQKAKKEQIQKLHNQNIFKIQQSVKKRPSFRF